MTRKQSVFFILWFLLCGIVLCVEHYHAAKLGLRATLLNIQAGLIVAALGGVASLTIFWKQRK